MSTPTLRLACAWPIADSLPQVQAAAPSQKCPQQRAPVPLYPGVPREHPPAALPSRAVRLLPSAVLRWRTSPPPCAYRMR
eukprot:5463679-Prymnesium_polylepis.1